MRSLALAGVLAVAVVAVAGCVPEGLTAGHPSATASGVPMKRRAVHVDHVDPVKVSQFEEARRQLLATYAAKGQREETTTIVETKDDQGRPEFLSMRPFGAYAELDRLNDAAAARAAAIGKDLDRLDAMTHATLVPPHANEIWLFHAELSYAPPGSPTEADATAARLSFEEVAPTSSDEYEAAVKGVLDALGRTKAPVARLAFSSSYGTGEMVTLWLARSAADLEALESAASEVGAAIAKEQAKTVKSATRVAFVRKELSTP
jgi:hypothetical protein